ncbi:hypothetical protein SBD_6096 [Streptomyces bottropensis ATCC 25435]|uniref:Uncharacterized protein n=1 Tax=Streptomyces bottropensis ATCC 25435 TaxID=1054862 RepID=M3FJA9_9ACTN|nr:hypothetical protein SBD_6096 [Streptomyces bottropensis ATCC 25435]
MRGLSRLRALRVLRELSDLRRGRLRLLVVRLMGVCVSLMGLRVGRLRLGGLRVGRLRLWRGLRGRVQRMVGCLRRRLRCRVGRLSGLWGRRILLLRILGRRELVWRRPGLVLLLLRRRVVERLSRRRLVGLLGWSRLVGRLRRRRVGGALRVSLGVLLRRLGLGTVRRYARLRTGSGVHGWHLPLAVRRVAGADRLARLVRIDGMGHVRGPPWGECVPKWWSHMDS